MQAPFRIETERLVIRCWQPEDAGALKRVIDANIDHLVPWMPWAAHEPEPLQQKTDAAAEFKAMFERDEDFIYGIFDAAETEVIGGTGLHPRSGPEAREIGYWIGAEHEGKGMISESTAALTRVGFELLASIASRSTATRETRAARRSRAARLRARGDASAAAGRGRTARFTTS